MLTNPVSQLKVKLHTPRQLTGALLTALLLGLSLAPARANPGEPAGAGGADGSVFDRVWQHAEIHQDPGNAVLQSLVFTGRYQLDYAVIDRGDYTRFNTRRWRMGGKADLFRQFAVHAEMEFDHNANPWYDRLSDAYVSWTPRAELAFKLGKQSASFTVDGSTSSKDLLTIDRNNLSNNLWFPDEYFSGISVGWKANGWRYFLGVFSPDLAGREFGNFNAGYYVVVNAGHDFARQLKVKEALLSAHYVYNEPHVRDVYSRPYEHIGSVNFLYETDRWGFRFDLAGGLGYLGQGDTWGSMLMPFYNFTEHVQLIGRYTHLSSAGVNGLRFARYESMAVPGRGDDYHEFYVGVNWFVYGHKLKVQTGVHYAAMDDDADDGGHHAGWAWTTGLRLSW
jgi:phosphate-selective porin OprO/OprP